MQKGINGMNSKQEAKWKVIKIRKDVYDALLRIQGLLQFKYGHRWGFSEIIAFLINHFEILINPEEIEGFKVYMKEENSEEKEKKKVKSCLEA